MESYPIAQCGLCGKQDYEEDMNYCEIDNCFVCPEDCRKCDYGDMAGNCNYDREG